MLAWNHGNQPPALTSIKLRVLIKFYLPDPRLPEILVILLEYFRYKFLNLSKASQSRGTNFIILTFYDHPLYTSLYGSFNFD